MLCAVGSDYQGTQGNWKGDGNDLYLDGVFLVDTVVTINGILH